MGSVVDFDARRRRRARLSHAAQSSPANMVACSQCGERHPIVRLQRGEQRCLTAFFDGQRWFCRNRSCRRAWLDGERKT